jgi:AP2 domain
VTQIIPLSKGRVALVDDRDYERVRRYKWHFTGRYAQTRTPSPERKHLLLHRFLLEAPTGIQVDHVNGDPLDCRRNNMRLTDSRGNNRNRRPLAAWNGRPPSSKYKGVWYERHGLRSWRAGISVGSRRMYLGRFQSEDEAALAYNAAARRLHGEFACVNVIE